MNNRRIYWSDRANDLAGNLYLRNRPGSKALVMDVTQNHHGMVTATLPLDTVKQLKEALERFLDENETVTVQVTASKAAIADLKKNPGLKIEEKLEW